MIGRPAFRVRREEALGCVANYAVGLDMSIRGTEDRSWRKSFDGATVLGPWLVTADELGDPGALDLRLEVDIILTGTPEGVGPVGPGDVMQAEIERIGAMAVRVRAA